MKTGDRVRLLFVPRGDVEQRERKRRAGVEDAGWIAESIEQIIALDPVVRISSIDEDGVPGCDPARRFGQARRLCPACRRRGGA